MRGRPMPGWLHVGSGDLFTDDQPTPWAERGTGYARSLPPNSSRGPLGGSCTAVQIAWICARRTLLIVHQAAAHSGYLRAAYRPRRHRP